MLVSQNLLDVYASTAILGDPVDQHRDFRHRGSHPVEQAQFEGHRNLCEPSRPIGLDLAIFNLLRARYDLGEPLALDCRCDPVVAFSHSLEGSVVWSDVDYVGANDNHSDD
jgi:hypothetical protein